MNEDGVIQITAQSLFHGYYPNGREEAGAWSTEDLGRFDEMGGLHVLGRRDAVIISGGEKVEPAEVEAVLRSTGQFIDVAEKVEERPELKPVEVSQNVLQLDKKQSVTVTSTIKVFMVTRPTTG